MPVCVLIPVHEFDGPNLGKEKEKHTENLPLFLEESLDCFGDDGERRVDVRGLLTPFLDLPFELIDTRCYY